jgi:hypothetical protein
MDWRGAARDWPGGVRAWRGDGAWRGCRGRLFLAAAAPGGIALACRAPAALGNRGAGPTAARRSGGAAAARPVRPTGRRRPARPRSPPSRPAPAATACLVLQGHIDDHTHPSCGDGVAPKQGHLLEQALCPRPEPSGPVILVAERRAPPDRARSGSRSREPPGTEALAEVGVQVDDGRPGGQPGSSGGRSARASAMSSSLSPAARMTLISTCSTACRSSPRSSRR